MRINTILSYLIYPGKGVDTEDQQEIAGAAIPHSGRLYQMLSEIFIRSEDECDIPISFSSFDGIQSNDCQSEVIDLLDTPNVTTGRKLAERLQTVTTKRSGLGLLFLIVGQSETEKKLLISRFPADQGIIAERLPTTLKVEFVDDVFLKDTKFYKAVSYKGSSPYADFWLGNAIDKQINYKTRDLAAYWIRDFLLSDFRTTSRAGTKRLAVSLKNAAAETSDPTVKREIAAAATLANNFAGEALTIKEFCERSQLSTETREAINARIKPDKLLDDRFEFDSGEFSRHLTYKSVELDNGALLTAELEHFDEAFQRHQVENDGDEYIYKTRGRIVDERLKKTK